MVRAKSCDARGRVHLAENRFLSRRGIVLANGGGFSRYEQKGPSLGDRSPSDRFSRGRFPGDSPATKVPHPNWVGIPVIDRQQIPWIRTKSGGVDRRSESRKGKRLLVAAKPNNSQIAASVGGDDLCAI